MPLCNSVKQIATHNAVPYCRVKPYALMLYEVMNESDKEF